jgi:prepilin-type N-terminal cleavage/methylation domain-containing protein
MKSSDTSAHYCGCKAFSLLEVLVAMAVLALMMTFMFALVANSLRSWESGVRQIEAVQAARVGLDRIANELQFAMSAGELAPPLSGGAVGRTNVIPFKAVVPQGTAAAPVPGDGGSVSTPPMSAQIFAVAPVTDPLAAHGPFTELGYYSAYNRSTNPLNVMGPRTYYLVWHKPTGQEEPKHNIYYRSAPTDSWFNNSLDNIGEGGTRWPLVDNCYSMKLQFAENTASGLAFRTNWTSTGTLPAGVLITLSVMDNKTAAKIRQLRPDGLVASDLAAGAVGDVPRILREGTVEVSRFVPFLNSVN